MYSALLLAGQPISWPKLSDNLTPFECFDCFVNQLDLHHWSKRNQELEFTLTTVARQDEAKDR